MEPYLDVALDTGVKALDWFSDYFNITFPLKKQGNLSNAFIIQLSFHRPSWTAGISPRRDGELGSGHIPSSGARLESTYGHKLQASRFCYFDHSTRTGASGSVFYGD